MAPGVSVSRGTTAGTVTEPSSSLGTVMDTQKVEDLPLSGRNPMGLANLIPTVRGVGFRLNGSGLSAASS